jgi:hypothetical protein
MPISDLPDKRILYLRFFTLLYVLVVFASGIFFPVFSQEPGGGSTYAFITDQAEFNFYNELIYRDQTKWIGRTICFRGSFLLHTDVSDIGKPYEQISGVSNNGEPVDVIAVLDHPIKTSEGYADVSPRMAKGEEVRVFGILRKCREVISRTGVVKVLPVLDLQLVFRSNDQLFKNPIWVGRSLRPTE